MAISDSLRKRGRGDRFGGTASSATHSLNLRTSPHAAQSPVFRGPLRARRLETDRTGSVAAVLCARSPMAIFQSPEFPGGGGRDRFAFLETGSHSGGDGARTPTRARSRSRFRYLARTGAEAGSVEAELLFLLGPGQRKVAREPGDGQVSRRTAFREWWLSCSQPMSWKTVIVRVSLPLDPGDATQASSDPAFERRQLPPLAEAEVAGPSPKDGASSRIIRSRLTPRCRPVSSRTRCLNRATGLGGDALAQLRFVPQRKAEERAWRPRPALR